MIVYRSVQVHSYPALNTSPPCTASHALDTTLLCAGPSHSANQYAKGESIRLLPGYKQQRTLWGAETLEHHSDDVEILHPTRT